MSEDKAVIALRAYVADYSSEDGMFQPKHYAKEFQRILAEIDSKPATEQAKIDYRAECWPESPHAKTPSESDVLTFAMTKITGVFNMADKAMRDGLVAVARHFSKQATQPARVPLTNEQIAKLTTDAHIAFCLGKHQTYEHAMTRAIERAHGIGEAE